MVDAMWQVKHYAYDRQGRPLAITDHKGRKVSYEWGDLGERRGMTYPDGRKAVYAYDGQMRLKEMMLPGAAQAVTYLYDEKGRLFEKQFPEGLRTRWLYDGKGQLKELIHEDKGGILDRYSYEYDGMGNKTVITRERRGLTEESGRYEYGYDALARLESVTRNGERLRSYAYDSFGNRTGMEDYETGRKTSSAYDALNRLVTAEEIYTGNVMTGSAVRRSYGYDRRGNLIREEKNGEFLHGYEYGAMDRMTKAWNGRGQVSDYFYNGLGQRMGRTINGEEEDYLLDLSKPYHNLLGVSKGDSRQSFYFDNNVSAMEEEGNLHFYLQDELGSPLRVSGYGAGKKAEDIGNEYLTYGYDEFGSDLYKELEEAGIPCPYDRQGEEQPFGYTGYRFDDVSGTYFAQAREYRAESGRFTAEDVIKGSGAAPETLNRYGYCWNNPETLVDISGCNPIKSALIKFMISVIADDKQGEFLMKNYVYGNGEDVYLNDEEWGQYMMANEHLKEKTGYYLYPIASTIQPGETKEIDIQIPMIIDDFKNKSGYMLLYGSNMYVGDYQIKGTISKDQTGASIYDLTYTFNDEMDPEFKYLDDVIEYSCLVNLKQFFDSSMTLKDYNIHISWSDKTVIYDGNGKENEGWLSDMEEIDMDYFNFVINKCKEFGPGSGYYETAIMMEEFIDDYLKYVSEHPEYYGCTLD